MNIAIIGAGFTGLTAGYSLSKSGHTVTLFEKATAPGGLALGYKKPGWDWTLEEYYHHWFTNDESILSLAAELNYPIVIKRPKTSTYVNGTSYQLDSPLHVLTFPKLTLPERIRMGAVLGYLRYTPFWKSLEGIRTVNFLKQSMGENAYAMIWEPQLVNKFGEYTKDISLAWFWARIHKRTASLAYPEGGFLTFAQHVAKMLQDQGGTIHYNTTVSGITKKKKTFDLGIHGRFDAVIVTLPSFSLLKLYRDLPESYRAKLMPLQGLGAMTLVLRLKKQFLRDNTYWLSICEKRAPVMAIVEHTNFMDKRHYNNEHIVYLGNYLPATDDRYDMTPEKLFNQFHPLLQNIHPGYEKELIGYDVFKTPFAQPIVPINYSRMIPSLKTPVRHLYLANMQQVYPWDRGTNYAVALGREVANHVITDA